MTRLTIIEHDGRVHTVAGRIGASVLEIAREHGLDGIAGECGGCLSCATCHVYVDAAWTDKLPLMTESENAMLDGTYCDREATSRLACQIKISPELDGLVLHVPERQM